MCHPPFGSPRVTQKVQHKVLCQVYAFTFHNVCHGYQRPRREKIIHPSCPGLDHVVAFGARTWVPGDARTERFTNSGRVRAFSELGPLQTIFTSCLLKRFLQYESWSLTAS